MKRTKRFLGIIPILFFLLSSSVLKAQISSAIDTKMKSDNMRNFQVEEIKVRWKKAALENCPGVPCVPPVCPTSTVTDVDGNIYNTVAIGTQCWTKENLRVTMYNDGTLIPLGDLGSTVFPVGTSTIWQNLTTGAYSIYDNESSTGTNATNYGFLYNWYAAKGVSTNGSTTYKNICPSGWHVPTDGELGALVTQLGGFIVAGGKMKSMGTTLWNSPNTGADNSSGFSALPGGTRFSFGSYFGVMNEATFWSATEDPVSGVAWFRQLRNVNGSVNYAGSDKHAGYSVRCLKD
jgi:uncharacterized protein (TIGR02145 family)